MCLNEIFVSLFFFRILTVGSMELLLVEMAGSTKVNFQCDRLLFFCLLLTLWGRVNQTSMYKTEGLPGFWGDLPPQTWRLVGMI